MRVIALQAFNDLKEDTTRHEGDVFTVEIERYEQIMAYRPDLIAPFEDEQDDPEKGEKPEGGEDEKAADDSTPEKGEEAEKPEKPEGEEAKEASAKEAKPAAKKTQRKNASK